MRIDKESYNLEVKNIVSDAVMVAAHSEYDWGTHGFSYVLSDTSFFKVVEHEWMEDPTWHLEILRNSDHQPHDWVEFAEAEKLGDYEYVLDMMAYCCFAHDVNTFQWDFYGELLDNMGVDA